MSEKPVPQINDINRPYFEGSAVGELRVRRCLKCDTRFRFAHAWCPSCWSDELGWERVSGKGRVSHFSVVYQAPSAAFAKDAPYVLALIELEGGVRMMSNVVDCDPETVHVGMAVTVTFVQRGEISLPMFRPAA